MYFFIRGENISIKIKKKYLGRERPSNDIIYNEKIRAKIVLVIDEEGQKLGEMPIEDALELAYSKSLDLVQVSKNNKVEVTKIVDYGKYRFEKRKRQQEAKKNQRIVENKEVRLTPNIGISDLEVKIKKAREFIEKGNNVKISLKFRGRQMANKEAGYEKIKEFLDAMRDIAVVDKEPVLKRNFLDAYISPKKKSGE